MITVERTSCSVIRPKRMTVIDVPPGYGFICTDGNFYIKLSNAIVRPLQQSIVALDPQLEVTHLYEGVNITFDIAVSPYKSR